jgi:hypothetical protein
MDKVPMCSIAGGFMGDVNLVVSGVGYMIK